MPSLSYYLCQMVATPPKFLQTTDNEHLNVNGIIKVVKKDNTYDISHYSYTNVMLFEEDTVLFESVNPKMKCYNDFVKYLATSGQFIHMDDSHIVNINSIVGVTRDSECYLVDTLWTQSGSYKRHRLCPGNKLYTDFKKFFRKYKEN